MTSTERVRELLDERGVEYRTHGTTDRTWFEVGNISWFIIERENGNLTADAVLLTPEQAIAATLGREPDNAAMGKLHDQMNAAMFKYEMAQGIEKRDGDEAIVVPWVAKMHALLEEAATIGSCNCSNNCTNIERTGTCLPHFWTHDGTMHVELPKLPDSISVRLPDQRDREVGSARVWQYTRGAGTCHDEGGTGANDEQVFNCSECGCVLSLYDRDGSNNLCTSFVYDYPRYCPECGRKVVDDG